MCYLVLIVRVWFTYVYINLRDLVTQCLGSLPVASVETRYSFDSRPVWQSPAIGLENPMR